MAIKRQEPKIIIVHHSLTKDTETVSWGAIRKYHTVNLGWNDIGYHAGIELIKNDYEILFGRMPNEQGAHTKSHNQDSIGICYVGNFDEMEPSEDQWLLGIKLINWLMYEYGIYAHQVFGHREFDPYKSCPGRLFSMSKLRQQLS